MNSEQGKDIIQLLPDHVANQIAAGEVVQRPASVIKELIENAVDANASVIQVFLQEAGKNLMQVIDNGSGMSVTDLRMAFERHATSKIRNTEDIFHIMTKGFRGEALPSIASVAQVEAKTKRQSDELGQILQIEGGVVKNQEAAVVAEGTTISVKNLFYNVPARRNFLKNNNVEFKHIQEEFLRVALAHENIQFQLFHNDSEVYHLKKANLKQRLVQVFGKKIESQLVQVNEDTDVIKIEGFVGKPESAKKNRGEQYFFVNNRFVKSPFLNRAVTDAFDQLLPNGYFPSYFLYLTIDPSKIDINVHPTKTEIKFEDEQVIFTLMRASVKHALGQFSVMPSLDFDQDPDWAFIPQAKKNSQIKVPDIQVDRNYNPFASVNHAPTFSQREATTQLYKDYAVEVEKSEVTLSSKISEEQWYNDNIKVFQFQNKYLITEIDQKLCVIDQNRAHQCVLFHKLLDHKSANILSQQLLFPIEIELSALDLSQLKSIEKQLVDFGFDVFFDSNQVLIHALPVELEQEDIPAIFADFLSELEFKETVDLNQNMAKILAKNAAIKKGKPLLEEQQIALVCQLLKIKNNLYTAYGKSIMIEWPILEIEKNLQ